MTAAEQRVIDRALVVVVGRRLGQRGLLEHDLERLDEAVSDYDREWQEPPTGEPYCPDPEAVQR